MGPAEDSRLCAFAQGGLVAAANSGRLCRWLRRRQLGGQLGRRWPGPANPDSQEGLGRQLLDSSEKRRTGQPVQSPALPDCAPCVLGAALDTGAKEKNKTLALSWGLRMSLICSGFSHLELEGRAAICTDS